MTETVTTLADAVLDALDNESRTRLPPSAARPPASPLPLVELVRGEIDGFSAERYYTWDHAPWILLVEEAAAASPIGPVDARAKRAAACIRTPTCTVSYALHCTTRRVPDSRIGAQISERLSVSLSNSVDSPKLHRRVSAMSHLTQPDGLGYSAMARFSNRTLRLLGEEFSGWRRTHGWQSAWRRTWWSRLRSWCCEAERCHTRRLTTSRRWSRAHRKPRSSTRPESKVPTGRQGRCGASSAH